MLNGSQRKMLSIISSDKTEIEDLNMKQNVQNVRIMAK
jgi:hypothetical protein